MAAYTHTLLARRDAEGLPAPRLAWGWPHSGLQVPVWQLCSQTRCPSYLQRHRIMLFEKSDSATSNLGFTTTWSERSMG